MNFLLLHGLFSTSEILHSEHVWLLNLIILLGMPIKMVSKQSCVSFWTITQDTFHGSSYFINPVENTKDFLINYLLILLGGILICAMKMCRIDNVVP